MPIARPLFLALTATVLSTALLLPPASAAQSSTPLRDYLVEKKAAIQTQSVQDGVPIAIHTKVTAESRSGVRRLRIGPAGPFQYLSDSGRDYAGYNLGAGSWDSLVGVLSSAIADEYLVTAYRADVDASVARRTDGTVFDAQLYNERLDACGYHREPACRCYRCGRLLIVDTVTGKTLVMEH